MAVTVLHRCLLYLMISVCLCMVRGNTDPCTESVATLSESWRNLNPSPGADPGKANCDELREGWYHFQLDGEDAQLPTSCLQEKVCSTVIALRVELKAGEDLAVLPVGNETEASVCGSYNVLDTLDCCVQRQPVRIKRCSKTKLIYRLPTYKVCPVAFCVHKVSEVVPADILARHGDRPRSLVPEPNKTAADPYLQTSSQGFTQETMTINTDHIPPISRTLRQSLDSSSTSIAAPPASSQTSLHPSPPSSPPSSPTTLPDVATSPIPESSAGATDSGPVPHPQASSTSPLPGSSPPPSAAWSSPPLSPSSLSADSSPSLSSSLSLLSSQSVSSSSPYVPSSVPSSTSPPLSSSASGLPSHQPSFTAVNSTGGPPNDSSSTAETPVNVADLSTLAASAAGNASDEVSSDRGPTTAAALSSAATTTPASSSADDNASVGATVSQGDARAVTVAASDDTSPPDKAVVTATTTTTASPSTASSVMAAMTRTSSGWTTPRAGPDEGPRSDQTVCFVVRGDYKASTLQWIKTKVSSAPFTPRTDVIFSKPRKKHQLTCVGMNITNPLTNDTFPASHVVAVLKNISIAENFQSAHAGLSLEMHEASCQNQCYEAKATSLSLYETNKPLFVALISIALLAMVALVLLALFLRWRKQGSWVVSVDQDHEDCENGASHNTLAVESPMTDSQIQQGEEKMAAAGEATLSMNGHRPPTPACDIPLADDDDGWVVPLEQATKL